MKLTGTIEKVDLIRGYTLVTDDGKRATRWSARASSLARSRGELMTDAVGFGMTGDPALQVRSRSRPGAELVQVAAARC
ncbi:MAG: hypothetical protein R3F62_25590 [Planctomycetota bacterium]